MELAMRWPLVVVGKALPEIVADGAHASGILKPDSLARQLRLRGCQIITIRRTQRVLSQVVLDVHEQQLLMLLLMMQYKFDATHDLMDMFAGWCCKQLDH